MKKIKKNIKIDLDNAAGGKIEGYPTFTSILSPHKECDGDCTPQPAEVCNGHCQAISRFPTKKPTQQDPFGTGPIVFQIDKK